jgi:hypothetical protein
MDTVGGYDIPVEWAELLSSTALKLDRITGWQEFKDQWLPIISNEINIEPTETSQVMVLFLYNTFFDDPEWSIDQARPEPTESEAAEDFELFRKALDRLLENAEDLLKQVGQLDIQDSIHDSEYTNVEQEFSTLDQFPEIDSKSDIPGRIVMGYKMPVGKIEILDSDHPVIGGWMTEEAWNKVKFNRIDELSPHEKSTYDEWRREQSLVDLRKEKMKSDEAELRSWIDRKINEGSNVVTCSPTQTVYTRSDFGVQCFLLSMLPRLSRRPKWMSTKDWIEKELGLSSIHDLYPVVTSEGRLFQLDDLIFKFGYGPNYFDWSKKKPFKLKGTRTILYLISIDIGRLSSRESSIVWKIGITSKKTIGETASESRYFGDIAKHVNIIKEKEYKDGRDAYMIEQMIVQLSEQETYYDRLRNDELYKQSEAAKAIELMDGAIFSQLGYTEWIFPYKSKEEVVSIFERMTSYGEFHGDGNVAYSPFKRDFQKE